MSFDGMKDIQSYNCPLNSLYNRFFNNCLSADVLEDNVRWLIHNKGNRNLMVDTLVTITDINIDMQIEMIGYFYDSGICYIWTNPLFYSGGKVPVCEDEQKNPTTLTWICTLRIILVLINIRNRKVSSGETFLKF